MKTQALLCFKSLRKTTAAADTEWTKEQLLGRSHEILLTYLLNAIGLSPGGSSTVQYSTVHIYTQTIHRTTQNKQYIEQQNNLGE